jgi:hypothetical protein
MMVISRMTIMMIMKCEGVGLWLECWDGGYVSWMWFGFGFLISGIELGQVGCGIPESKKG